MGHRSGNDIEKNYNQQTQICLLYEPYIEISIKWDIEESTMVDHVIKCEANFVY